MCLRSCKGPTGAKQESRQCILTLPFIRLAVVDFHFNMKPATLQYWDNRQRVLKAIAVAVKKQGVEFTLPSLICNRDGKDGVTFASDESKGHAGGISTSDVPEREPRSHKDEREMTVHA